MEVKDRFQRVPLSLRPPSNSRSVSLHSAKPMRYPRKSNSASKSRSLSLVEFSGEIQSLPLKTVYPQCSSQLRLRRSPRFTASPNSSDLTASDRSTQRKSPKQPRSAHASGLRRSPRLNSAATTIQRTIAWSDSGAPAKSDSVKAMIRQEKLESTKSDRKSLRWHLRFSMPAVIIGAESRTTNLDILEVCHSKFKSVAFAPSFFGVIFNVQMCFFFLLYRVPFIVLYFLK